MKKNLLIANIFAFSALLTRLVFAPMASAVCPVCTAAVVAGLGLSRFLGIDDTISGLWVGGIILSLSLWTANWLQKKYPKINPKISYPIVIALMYILTFVPLILTGVTGHPLNTLWGVDKLVLGTTFGSALFLIAVFADVNVRKIKGKQLFAFQKVVFPVGLLAIFSVVFYFLTK